MKFFNWFIKQPADTILGFFGYKIRRVGPPRDCAGIPDFELYYPVFSPWLATKGSFSDDFKLAAPKTLVSAERCHVLYSLADQALSLDGNFWECGVYKGGTAAMFAAFLKRSQSGKRLHLFDTFEGMPETDSERDWHQKGDFSDTSLAAVKAHVGYEDICVYHQGFIPDTFRGLESEKIAFAHIDVDIYRSIIDCLEFIWPRLSEGGFLVFDDYGFPTCPGARKAVDEFFVNTSVVPLCLATGQAIVFKSHSQNGK